MKTKLLSAVAVTALLMGVTLASAQEKSGGGALSGGNPGTEGVCPPEECPQGAAEAPQPGSAEAGQALQDQGQESMPAQADQGQGEEQTGTAATKPRKKPGAREMQTGQTQNPDEPVTTGSTNATADITEEQQSEIRTTFRDHRVDPVADVDFDINIGVAVPGTIVLHPLPPRIIEIVPAYAGYEYFVLADGTIIIVDPGTHAIVYVLA